MARRRARRKTVAKIKPTLKKPKTVRKYKTKKKSERPSRSEQLQILDDLFSKPGEDTRATFLSMLRRKQLSRGVIVLFLVTGIAAIAGKNAAWALVARYKPGWGLMGETVSGFVTGWRPMPNTWYGWVADVAKQFTDFQFAKLFKTEKYKVTERIADALVQYGYVPLVESPVKYAYWASWNSRKQGLQTIVALAIELNRNDPELVRVLKVDVLSRDFIEQVMADAAWNPKQSAIAELSEAQRNRLRAYWPIVAAQAKHMQDVAKPGRNSEFLEALIKLSNRILHGLAEVG
jgi:hypothetical protein